MNRIFLFFLAFFARCIITRHHPFVIGVTGSVGKTTITSHVSNYLKALYGNEAVQDSPYHYNGEYGLPLTIIGAKTGGRNPFLWGCIFIKAIFRCFRPYPKYLILEYGIDHPGEMEYLLSIVKPDIAIISPVAPNHLEQFGTLENYRAAKLLLAESARSHAIIHDSLRHWVRREALYYGKDATSSACIIQSVQKIDGIDSTIRVDDAQYSFMLTSFGDYQIENILPLYLLAESLSLDMSNIAQYAHLFVPESGRSTLLRGLAGSTIIDGSYNGGYESMCRGIDSLVPFLTSHRLICLLGDMRELGEHARDIHEKLAHYIEDTLMVKGSDVNIFLVGPLMREYVFSLLPLSRVQLSSRHQGREIRELLLQEEKPTIIYVKGSQNTIFLEEGIREFLLDPSDESELCRQSSSWKEKKEIFFRSLDV